jgi:hypothetical protein
VTRPFGAHIWQQWGHRIFWNFFKKIAGLWNKNVERL